MFNISFPELIVILLLAFLILGPGEMGKIARFLGKTVRKSGQLLAQIKSYVNDEAEDSGLKDVKDSVEEVKNLVDQANPVADIKKTVSDANPITEVKKELDLGEKLKDELKNKK